MSSERREIAIAAFRACAACSPEQQAAVTKVFDILQDDTFTEEFRDSFWENSEELFAVAPPVRQLFAAIAVSDKSRPIDQDATPRPSQPAEEPSAEKLAQPGSSLGENLKTVLNELELSVSEFAELLGLKGPAAVYTLMRSNRPPRHSTVRKYAEVLEVDPRRLYCFDTEGSDGSEFSRNVHAELAKKTMTPADLSVKLGLTPGAVAWNLRNGGVPRSGTVRRYAEALGVEPSQLWPYPPFAREKGE